MVHAPEDLGSPITLTLPPSAHMDSLGLVLFGACNFPQKVSHVSVSIGLELSS